MYADNELLFPTHVIPKLRQARGEEFRALVERVSRLPDDHPEKLGFALMMIRLDGCLTCETDSYRAMRGCTACAKQTLRRFKNPDEDLLRHYQKALSDIQAYVGQEMIPLRVEEPVSAQAA
jgi:hypothetical protein